VRRVLCTQSQVQDVEHLIYTHTGIATAGFHIQRNMTGLREGINKIDCEMLQAYLSQRHPKKNRAFIRMRQEAVG
jgi:hypothetical protein